MAVKSKCNIDCLNGHFIPNARESARVRRYGESVDLALASAERRKKREGKEKEREKRVAISARDLAVHENPVTPVFPCCTEARAAPEPSDPLLSASYFIMTIALRCARR